MKPDHDHAHRLQPADDLGLRRLHAEPTGSAQSLSRIERNVMQRIESPVSRVRAFALATPARVAGTFLLGGLAAGAGTVATLSQLGISVLHVGEQEYVHVDGETAGEHVLLPVETGAGAGLVDLLQTGSSLLTLEEEPALPEAPAPRTGRVFHAGPNGLVPADGSAPAGEALIRTPDGRERRIEAEGPRER